MGAIAGSGFEQFQLSHSHYVMGTRSCELSKPHYALSLLHVGCWNISPYVLGILHIVYHVGVYCVLGIAMLVHRY